MHIKNVQPELTINNIISKPKMTNRQTKLSFAQMWNLSFGFFGVQIAYSLQSANISRIFATLGADPHQLSFFWILPPLMGMLVQPLIGKWSDRTWCRMGRRKPYLLVGVDVASGIGYELMQDEARIWRVDISNAPCVVVVLDGIPHVKVFWLHGPKDDIRQFVFSHFYYICILRRIRPSFFTLYSSLFVLPSSFLTLKSLMVGDDHVFVGVVHRNECLGTIIVVHGRQNVGVGKCG